MNLFLRSFLSLFICSLLFLPLNAQQPLKNYDKQWKSVEAYISKQLPRSALTEVRKIYDLAKKDKQSDQQIKALVYIARLQEENRENNQELSIAELEKEIAGSQPIPAAILKSIVAGAYWQYYQNNRWKFYGRTNTKDFDKNDIATWTLDDLFKKIAALYLASIKDEKLLQQTAVSTYEGIITKGNMRHLRPTLYDLLAFRALSYFESDEVDIKKPAYAFEIDQASAFDPAADFITKRFISSDSFSLQHKALLLYQKLIAFHIKDVKPDALLDADLQRLKFVHENSVHPLKDSLYLLALTHLTTQYGQLPAASQAWYLLASFYKDRGNEYKPYGDSTYRMDLIRARDICEKMITQKDSSEGKYNCYNLLNELNRPSLEFKVEKVNSPSQPFRALINYKNISTLYLRIVTVTKEMKQGLANYYDDKYWSSILAASPLRKWKQELPLPADLQEHKAEIKIDGLPVGEFILLASDKETPDIKSSLIGARYLYVSGISNVNNKENYFVLDRESGAPLAGARVQIWNNRYDYSSSKTVKEKGPAYTTDANGYFRLEKDNTDKANYGLTRQIEINYKNDHLFVDDNIRDYYYYSTNEPFKEKNSVFLFTDRSIYRPGQLLYFKGIVLNKKTEKDATTNSNYNCVVFLKDANGKMIDSVEVRTNEYGSFNSNFKLPASGLNGSFSLYTSKDNGSASFRVEEYKRPKYYVEYEPLKGTYKVNDRIRVTGIAKAYAGNNIDGANVSYRIVRQPRFIYSWMFWRWWQPPTQSMEIAHGETKTDKDGKFNIEFTAIPDLKIDRKFEPVFDYTVFADVTDINGETRSGEKQVSVSYKALQLQATVPGSIEADSLKNFFIKTSNLNGEYQPAQVQVNITRIKTEDRLIRSRYWERPDQFVMSKAEYINNFPHDEYDNETDRNSWDKLQLVYTRSDSSRMNGNWQVNPKLEPGTYQVEIIASDKGEQIKDIRFLEIKGPVLPSKYLWTGNIRSLIEPGDTATIELGTAATDVFLIHQLDRSNENDKRPVYSYFRLSNEKRTYRFPVGETNRGGFGAGWLFVKHNRIYQLNQTITVPWTNKDLEIEYASFRDKTLPGSEEKWKVRIKGYKSDKVAAEMLATMYDASLDQFYSHGWAKPWIWPVYYTSDFWLGNDNFLAVTSNQKYNQVERSLTIDKRYDELIEWHSYGGRYYFNVGARDINDPNKILGYEVRLQKEAPVPKADGILVAKNKGLGDKDADVVADTTAFNTENIEKTGKAEGEVKVRKNFNETAFFFPELRTDSTGAIEFSFTMPEALTRWKFMALAHTKDASFGSNTKEIVTQKELMVQPNPPRFLREGDKMEFSTKIVNLSSKEFTGIAELQLYDATTNESVDGWFRNMMPKQYFTVAAGQSEAVKFPIEVPYLFNKALVWRIVAKTDNLSDGEENMLPVLTNRMLVTESLPLNIRGTGTKEFKFDKLINSGDNTTLQHHALTVEFTSNPAWYAIQALPYLMEYPYECAEQTWNRYYANALATYISNSSPRIKQVFDKWRITDTAALMSNLQKNQELKAVLLEETPWVLQATNEAQQKRNLALLFDMVKMSEQLNAAYFKLKAMQSSNGGFVWFSGGPDDRYITQYIVTGIGHLQNLKALDPAQQKQLNEILKTAIPYLDRKIKQDYDDLVKNKTDLKKYQPGYTIIQYLYMRSFFKDHEMLKESQKAYDYFRSRLATSWTGQSKYMQAMIALALYRNNDKVTPAAILRSLKETAIVNDEMGMYYKDMVRGWWWYQAPIETQALIIEAFDEISKDAKTTDDLRTWLLKNKQTNNWSTTKSTAEACYALLLRGTKWLDNEPTVSIKLGNTTINSADNKQEAGTGYFKTTIEGQKVKPEMGNISVTVGTPQPSNKVDQSAIAWGSVYWQYFEDLDKITPAATPLSLKKKLFIEKNSDRGPVMTPVNDGDIIKVGDKVKVRIELRVDRDMEYVHLKDMRASALEPVNVLSSYKWQGGMGYYESTKDASTNFFISYLAKGTYVFEYTLFATHAGNFSNGISSIQCMYAPEFGAHSEGIRINIEER